MGIRLALSAFATGAVLSLAGWGSAANAQDLPHITVGYNSAVDQIAVPAAVEQGFFEDEGLDVDLAPPFPSGVDALNALQAGTVQFVHVGAPLLGALLSGMEVVYIGGYTGKPTQIRSDETMALVAGPDSEIDPEDLSTLRGKRIASTLGSTNHLYIRNLLQANNIAPDEAELINTPPPDMAVALQTGGVDAVVAWDPWPVVAKHSVDGAYDVLRGGGHVANVGYMVAMRDYVEENPEIVEKFLVARARSDKWVRENPDEAAELATRWVPGTSLEVAQESMQAVIQLMDGRVSACTVLGMLEGMAFTIEMQNREPPAGFDPVNNVMAAASKRVVQSHPELYEGLPPIEGAAVIPDDASTWDRKAAEEACPKAAAG
jgi:sulfonate transport system substrate-binding protein